MYTANPHIQYSDSCTRVSSHVCQLNYSLSLYFQGPLLLAEIRAWTSAHTLFIEQDAITHPCHNFKGSFKHPEADAKWSTFCRRHFQMHFLESKLVNFLHKVSLKYVPQDLNENMSALVKMAWYRTGDNPLSDPMMSNFIDASMRRRGLNESSEQGQRPLKVRNRWLIRYHCFMCK